MNEIWLYTIGSTLIVSLISLLGIVTLSLKDRWLRHILILLVSFSAGALLGDTFIHILPETFEEFGFGLDISLYIIIGILTFFILEKIIHWHHCHSIEHEHTHKPFVFTNLLGDGLHNFVDGLFIASSYLVDIKVGIATTIAVLLHEIPQEIGDFGVLIHGGMKKSKAILFNLGSALIAIIGAVIVLVIGSANQDFLKFILPFTAGGFIYIACTDLFPELHKDSEKTFDSILHLVFVILGIGVMMLLLLLE